MTIQDLIDQLTALKADMGGDALVVQAKDAEGNAFSPTASAETAMYWAESSWSGEMFMPEADRQAQPDPGDYEAAPGDAVRAVFLWPIN